MSLTTTHFIARNLISSSRDRYGPKHLFLTARRKGRRVAGNPAWKMLHALSERIDPLETCHVLVHHVVRSDTGTERRIWRFAGNPDGIELKQFTTLSEANAYHQQMMMSLNMAVDLPVQLIRIGNEPSFSVLRERFEEAYRQRVGEHRNFTVALQSVCSIYKRCTDRLSEFLSHPT